MAFSTQKDFFNVPFMNERIELGCRRACVKLKSYESTIDNRSWASDEAKQSKFLSDLVTCQIPMDGNREEGIEEEEAGRGPPATGNVEKDSSGYTSDSSQGPSTSGKTGSPAKGGGHGKGKGHGKAGSSGRASPSSGTSSVGGKKSSEGPVGQTTNLASGGDSLLECANVHLAEYQKMLNIQNTLEKQLEVSNERLQTAKEENKKIREILASKMDSNTAKNFYNKIQKYAAAGKLDKNEENEMLQIYQKMENMNKAYEILQAENFYLKRLVEKLTTRVKLDKISTQPEKSTDIDYLHKEINSLRRECILLRQMEDDYQRIKQQQQKDNHVPSITEEDAENIKAIIKERNSLREKCKSFKALEQQVKMLEQKTEQAQQELGGLNSNLNNKTQYINKMEGEMQNMQQYYEGKCQKACFQEECLKAQLEDLKEELVKAKCEAQRADMLTMEVSCLRNEVLKRDIALNDYDCQYKQLMDIVNELQAVRLQYLHDSQTQTACKGQTDELAFYTAATLNEIIKELKCKTCIDDELFAALGIDPNNFNLEEYKQKMQGGGGASSCEADLADALARLKELEFENSKLKEENQSSEKKFRASEERLSTIITKMEKLDQDITLNGEEVIKVGKDLDGVLSLVKGISDVQLENQQLANAVSAINSRDDQKIIDDLRRQLEEEMAKLKKCQLDNDKLLEEAAEREAALRELEDINNKLNEQNNKLRIQLDNVPAVVIPQAQDPNQNQDKDKLIIVASEGDVKVQHLSEGEKDINEKDKDAIDEINKDKTDEKDRDEKEKDIQDKDMKDKDKNDMDVEEFEVYALAAEEGYVKKKDGEKKIDRFGSPKVEKKKRKEELQKEVVLDDFVNKKSDALKSNVEKGRKFQREFRKILEEFICECKICYCGLFKKSKLYIICHKLSHNGIGTLSFRELAYVHKKIYAQADLLLPGCLLDMILSDHKEQVESMLQPVATFDNEMLGSKESITDQKCCSCKNELCCTNSEQMLKDKVSKLEADIETAREYLEALRNAPLKDSVEPDNDDSTDTNNSTYRATSPAKIQQKQRFPKQLKKIKTRINKSQDS